MRIARSTRTLTLLLILVLGLVACVTQSPGVGSVHRWWAGLGPVLPHDTFPADCSLCHVGDRWNRLTADFSFDHEAETGYALEGAHAEAYCLRCHNDRGPVQVFAERGCAGCHEDTHEGELGPHCASCHDQRTWFPSKQYERHNRSRFPLTGAHAAVSCHQCHPGARVGEFVPTDPECLTCHVDDLAATDNPPHIPLGWVDNCQECHLPTAWEQAVPR